MPTIYMKSHLGCMKLRSINEDWLQRMGRRGEEMGFRRCTWFEYFFGNWFSR